MITLRSILVALVVTMGAQAQDYLTLSGVISDATTKRPIALATVSVVGGYAIKDEQSDQKGIFILKFISTVQLGKIIRIIVTKDGYETYDEQTAVAPSLPQPISLVREEKHGGPTKPRRKPLVSSLSARGHVATTAGTPVGGTKVMIHDGPSSTSTKEGDFKIDNIPPPFTVGFPATFEVVDWIIEDPFVGKRGRTYLPDPKAEPVALVVRRPGDLAFLQGPSVERILQARAFFLDARGFGSNADLIRPTAPYDSSGAKMEYAAQPRRMATHVQHVALPSLRFAQVGSNQVMPGWNDYLSARASEIGFPKEALIAAIEKWSRTVETSYQKGLLSLYRDDYDQAASDFRQALEEGKMAREQLYMSLAYAEYKGGDFTSSLQHLQKLIELHPQDTLLQQSYDLAHQRLKRTPRKESEPSAARFGISRQVLSYMEDGDFEAVFKLFDSEYLSSVRVGAGFDLQVAFSRLGTCGEIVSQTTRPLRDEILYVTAYKCDKRTVDLIIQFDDTNLMAGLWLIPQGGNPAVDSDQMKRTASDVAKLLSGQGGETYQQLFEPLDGRMRSRIHGTNCQQSLTLDQLSDSFYLKCRMGKLIEVQRIEIDADARTADVHCLFSKGRILLHIAFDPNREVSDISYSILKGSD